MTNVQETRGVVLAGATALLMGRLARSDGQLVTAAETVGISYRIVARAPCCSADDAPVVGHDQALLTPSEVLFESLQADAAWEVDSTGYNFRHEIDISSHAAFPEAGRSYAVRYELTPVTGQPIVFRFLIEAI